MSRYLVSGGAGFVGSHLVDRLLNDGSDVVVIDNLSSGLRSNLEHRADDEKLRVIEADVCEVMPADFQSESFDGVFHLASPASPPEYLKWPLETLDVGSIGTRRMLDIARDHDARFLVTSTSEVYGDPTVHPQAESYWGNVNPIGPRSVYDEAKRFAEAVTMAYHRTFGVDIRIARLFNTYGPRLRPSDGRVISNFIAQALSGEPLTVFGDGTQTRSFGYVDDTVEGLIRLYRGDVTTPVNIGNPVEFTMLELAQLVVEITGRDTGIEHRPLPQDDPTQRCPDISLARAELGWEPKVQLREGLVQYIDWLTKAPGT